MISDRMAEVLRGLDSRDGTPESPTSPRRAPPRWEWTPWRSPC
ncbi:hypothetical protein ACFQ0T_34765 [Kitasatospora gansuensis]